MVDKKRKSKRLSTRKKNKIVKKIRKQEIDRRKEFRLKRKSKAKIPKHVLMTDEDLQRLNDIKNNERARKDTLLEKTDPFKKFIDGCDIFLLVVDPRDVFSLPSFDIFEGKTFYMVLNYKKDIPVEQLFDFYENANKSRKTFIVTKDTSDDRLNKLNNEFNVFIGKNSLSVGILGEKHVGKTFVRNMVLNSKIYTLNSEQKLSSLLRECLTMRDVLYKNLLQDLLENQINKEDLSYYFSIQVFDRYEEFIELMSEKFGINKDKDVKVCKMLLDEFYNKKITFYYNLNNKLQIIFNK